MQRLSSVIGVVILASTLGACSLPVQDDEIPQPDYSPDYSEQVARQAEEEGRRAAQEMQAKDFEAMPWSCGWDPTMNENWHDDVLCVKGSERLRPELLPDWDFVTQEDMMAEAARYEAYLNSQ